MFWGKALSLPTLDESDSVQPSVGMYEVDSKVGQRQRQGRRSPRYYSSRLRNLELRERRRALARKKRRRKQAMRKATRMKHKAAREKWWTQELTFGSFNVRTAAFKGVNGIGHIDLLLTSSDCRGRKGRFFFWVSPGRLQSLRHRPRQVDDRSPGRGGMA